MERAVHIIPLGWERDRVAAAVIEAKAHRVYLLSRQDDPLNKHFIRLVRGDLRGHVAAGDIVDVLIKGGDEFRSVLLEVSRIVRETRNQGDRPFIHLSGGSKRGASAAMLAACYHADSIGGLYYARSRSYAGQQDAGSKLFKRHGFSIGYEGTDRVPVLPVVRPTEPQELALAGLYQDSGATLRDITRHLHRAQCVPFDEYPRIQPNPHAKRKQDAELAWDQRCRRLVVKPLEQQGLIRGQPGITRALHYSLTETGEYYAILTGRLTTL